MFCTVYQLRRNGQRLSPAEVKKTEIKGSLSFGPRGKSPVVDARLSDNEGTDVLVLEHASLVKIDRGGILLRGLERFGYSEHVRQAWWCVPEATSATPQ